MLIAETEYKLQVEDDIRPFRDVLLGMFFISVGMQLDGGMVLQQLVWVALAVVLLLAGRAVVLQPLARYFGLKTADANIAAALIAPGGEFGFVLLTLGLTTGALPSQAAQVAIAAMLISMLAGAVSCRALPNASTSGSPPMTSCPLRRYLQDRLRSMGRRDHVVICGLAAAGNIWRGCSTPKASASSRSTMTRSACARPLVASAIPPDEPMTWYSATPGGARPGSPLASSGRGRWWCRLPISKPR